MRPLIVLAVLLAGCPSKGPVETPVTVDASRFGPVTLSEDDALRAIDAALMAALQRLGPLEGEDFARPSREADLLGQAPDGALRVEIRTLNLMDDSVYGTRHRWHGVLEAGAFVVTGEEPTAYRCRRGDSQRQEFGLARCP